MTKKTYHPNQSQLFTANLAWNDLEIQPSVNEIPLTMGEPGTYVDVEERAKLLITALGAFSQRNSRRTFPLAAYTSQYSSPIWQRYQEYTEPVVIPGARRNAEMYDRIAAHSFWHATGFPALKKVVGIENIIRPKQIDERAIKMWDSFQDLYGRPKDLKDRNGYKRKLGKFVTNVVDSEANAA